MKNFVFLMLLALWILILHIKLSSSLDELEHETPGTLRAYQREQLKPFSSLYPRVNILGLSNLIQDIPMVRNSKIASDRVLKKIQFDSMVLSDNRTSIDCEPVTKLNCSDRNQFWDYDFSATHQIRTYGNDLFSCSNMKDVNSLTSNFCNEHCARRDEEKNRKTRPCTGSDMYCSKFPCSLRKGCFCFEHSFEDLIVVQIDGRSYSTRDCNNSIAWLCPNRGLQGRSKRSPNSQDRILADREMFICDLIVIQKKKVFEIFSSTNETLAELTIYAPNSNTITTTRDLTLPTSFLIPTKDLITSGDLHLSYLKTSNYTQFCKTIVQIADVSVCDFVFMSDTWSKIRNYDCFFQSLIEDLSIIKALIIFLATCQILWIVINIRSFFKLVKYTIRTIFFFITKFIKIITQFFSLIFSLFRGRNKSKIENNPPLLPVSVSDVKKPSSSRSRYKSLALTALLLSKGRLAESCEHGLMIPVRMTDCQIQLDKRICETRLDVSLDLSTVGAESCFTMVDVGEQGISYSMIIKYVSMHCFWDTELQYYTSNWNQTARFAHLCPGDCYDCESKNSPIRESYGGRLKPECEACFGKSFCRRAPGCAGNGCGRCDEACVKWRVEIFPIGQIFEVRTPRTLHCNPIINVKINNAENQMILNKTSNPLIEGTDFDLDSLFKVNFIQKSFANLLNLGTDAILSVPGSGEVRNRQLGESWLIKQYSQMNSPRANLIGDFHWVKSNNLDDLRLEDVAFDATSLDCRTGIANERHVCFTSTPALSHSKNRKSLPTTHMGMILNPLNAQNNLPVEITGAFPIKIDLKSQKDFSITKTIAVVCPELEFISLSGNYDSQNGATILVNARSTCSPGMVSLEFSDKSLILFSTGIFLPKDIFSSFRIEFKSVNEIVDTILKARFDAEHIYSIVISGSLEKDLDKIIVSNDLLNIENTTSIISESENLFGVIFGGLAAAGVFVMGAIAGIFGNIKILIITVILILIVVVVYKSYPLFKKKVE